MFLHILQVSRLHQEYDRKELNLQAEHGEELKCAQLQAENELKEVHIPLIWVGLLKSIALFSYVAN